MENLGYSQALRLPYVARLAARYAVATHYDAVAHPSLPNYLALTSGHTWVTSDCWYCYVPGPDLAGELSRAGIAWGAYMEGLPAPCWLGPWWPPGRYAGKHDPFRYYLDVRGSPALCARIQPLTSLTAALRRPSDAAAVPRFVWVTPDLCHDGHDCPPARADAWLRGFVPLVLRSEAWRAGGVLFVTWDEAEGDDRGGGGRVLTLVVAPDVRPGLRVDVPYSHYSLLRTVEEAWGLPLLGGSGAAGVRAMTAFWSAPRPGRAA